MIDTQLKRGLLEISVLSVLSKGGSHGYQIIKDLSPYIEISESTLYPILRRLESAGCLAAHSVAHNGRLRKIYDITPEGNVRIGEFLENWREVIKVYNFIEEGWNREQI